MVVEWMHMSTVQMVFNSSLTMVHFVLVIVVFMGLLFLCIFQNFPKFFLRFRV